MTNIWDEKPKSIEVWIDTPSSTDIKDDYYNVDEMDAWLEKLKAVLDGKQNVIDMLERLGIISRFEQGWMVKDFDELKEKAEKWDKLMDHPHFADMPIENILAESEFLTTRRNEMGLALQQIRAEVNGKCKVCLKAVTDCNDCDYGMIKNILEDVYPKEETGQ